MKTKWFFLLSTLLILVNGFCQQPNVIRTAPDVLSVFTDPRSISLGNSGVASEADVFSMYCNPAKYAFIKDKTSFGLSYVPYRFSNSNFASLAYAQKLGKISTIAASIRYFSQGELTEIDPIGTGTITYRPIEFALDFAYSARLNDHLSLALAARYISSSLSSS